MRALRAALALLVPLSGCLEALLVDPGFEPPPTTTVWVFDGPSGLSAVVLGPEDSRQVTLPDEGAVYALAYRREPEALLLPRGRLAPATRGQRRLPPPERALVANLGAHPLDWTKAEGFEAVRQRFRLPDLEPEACLTAGGCLRSEDGVSSCSPACDLEAVPAPAAPEPPCLEGWTARERYCAPAPLPDAPCPLGRRYDLDAEACVQIAACPNTPFYEPAGSGPFAFVQAGGEAGDGSRERPFPSLQQALQEAPARATILLSAGAHQLPATTQSSLHRRIIGLCPEHTELGLAGPWRLSGSALELSRLSLSGPPSEDTLVVHASTVALSRVEILRTRGRVIDSVASHVFVTDSTIREASLEPSHAMRAYRGRVELRRSSIYALGAVRLQPATRAHIEDVVVDVIDGPYEHTIDCSLCEGLSLSRVRIRGSRANAVAMLSPRTATVADLGVWDARGDGIWIGACEPEIHCEGQSYCPPACGAELSPYTKASLRGISVQTAAAGGVTVAGIEAQLEDIVVRDVRATGILVAVPTDYTVKADLRRAYVERALSGAVRVIGDQGTALADLSDVFVVGTDRVRHERKPTIDLDFTTARLVRAAVRDSHSHGVAVWCGPVELEDIDVRGADGSGVFFKAWEPSRASRVFVENTTEAAIDVDSQRPSLSVLTACESRYPQGDRQVQVQGLRAERTPAGALVTGGARLDLHNFDLTPAQLGLRVGGSSDARFRSGRVTGAEVGASLPPGVTPAVYFDNVEFEGSEVPLRRE